MIPIPKKENLSFCDNWHGIALLEVVGKVVAKSIQNKLQQVKEAELPESQCGFCSGMVFTLCQLVEKSVEHRSKVFVIYVDLRKAYEPVPPAALWLALEKLTIPEKIITLMKSFHESMKAQIRIGGELLEENINVENGLRQRCTLQLGPTLFNVYSCLVAKRWKERQLTLIVLEYVCAIRLMENCSEDQPVYICITVMLMKQPE